MALDALLHDRPAKARLDKVADSQKGEKHGGDALAPLLHHNDRPIKTLVTADADPDRAHHDSGPRAAVNELIPTGPLQALDLVR